jgi:excisionase family DNA binding protein
VIPVPEEQPTMSVEEAAEALGIGRSAAYECVHRGEVPSIRLGRRLRVPTAALRVLLGIDPSNLGVETADIFPIRRGAEQ